MRSLSTQHQQENQAPLYRDKNLLIIFTVSLITFLVLASVPPAFPKIIQALNVPPQKIGLLISVISVNGAFCNLGRIIGPMLMGVAFGIGGISGVFYAAAGIAIATQVIFRYCIRASY